MLEERRVGGNPPTATQRRYPVSLCFNFGRYRPLVSLDLCSMINLALRPDQEGILQNFDLARGLLRSTSPLSLEISV